MNIKDKCETSRAQACQRYLERATTLWKLNLSGNTLEDNLHKLRLHRRVLLAELLLLRALSMKRAMVITRRGINLQTMNIAEVESAIQRGVGPPSAWQLIIGGGKKKIVRGGI